jgi:ketosteroid isomerase-like protein
MCSVIVCPPLSVIAPSSISGSTGLRRARRWDAESGNSQDVHMNSGKASQIVRRIFTAYEKNDRAQAESVLAENFTFSSPPDPHLDRAAYFERCWPNSEQIKAFRFQKIIEDDGEVFVTYELEKTDGSKGRNTEFFVVDGDKIKSCDLYFGPSV